jgi:hypothetical protein
MISDPARPPNVPNFPKSTDGVLRNPKSVNVVNIVNVARTVFIARNPWKT